MTKEAYFELCEMMGTEPVDEEIPFEIDDFPSEIQEILTIYSFLPDRIDSMAGKYLGKDYGNIEYIFKLHNVPKADRKLYYEYLLLLDRQRKKAVNTNSQTDTKPPSE